MTERNEQGFVRDISIAIANINQSNQSSKDKVRALINLPFDFNDVPLINNYINGETTQAVECIDELNNIAILNEQILEFDETLKSRFEERHKELVEALMNRLEGVFKMYNNENLNQSVQPTYPEVEQPVDVQTPQVEEFSPVTPVESYAAPQDQPVEVYNAAPEAFAEPAVQEQTYEVPPMEMNAAVEPAYEAPSMEMEAPVEPALEVPQMGMDAPVEPTLEVPPMGMDTPVEPTLEVPPMGMDTPVEPTLEVSPMEMNSPVEPTLEVPPMEMNVPVEPTLEVPPMEVTPIPEPEIVEEAFVGPELNDELFSREAESLAGIISPVEENLPESADLNAVVETPVEEAKEEPVVEDEEDEGIRRIREHHREMEEVEVRMWKNKKSLEEKRAEIADLEQGLAADEEELERLRRM